MMHITIANLQGQNLKNYLIFERDKNNYEGLRWCFIVIIFFLSKFCLFDKRCLEKGIYIFNLKSEMGSVNEVAIVK